MTTFPPLPDDAVAAPLTTRRAAELGVSAAALSGPLWQPMWRGVHLWHTADPTRPLLRAQSVAALLPDGAALGGWAALYLRGCREIDGRVGRSARLRPIVVCAGPAGLVGVRRGLVIDRGLVPEGEVSTHHGMPLVSVERAVYQIARRDGPEAAPAAADAACRSAITTQRRLVAFAATMSGRPGVPQFRLVTHLVSGRAASVPESHLRYIWVVESGLPLPLVNRMLVDSTGLQLGAPDLLDLESGLVGEYDGAHHRELDRHTHDNSREEDFEAHNLVVVRATALDVWPGRPALVRRIRAGRERGAARDRTRDDWGVRVA